MKIIVKIGEKDKVLAVAKRRRRAGVAEADKSDKKREASAMQTIMRPMKNESRKSMSRKMMREKEKRN